MQQRKNHQDLSLETRDIPFLAKGKNIGFLQISSNQGRNKKVVQEKVTPFGVIYSWLTFCRLKTDDHV